MDAMGSWREFSRRGAAAAAVPILDVESAISRMLGSRSLYISMMEMFRAARDRLGAGAAGACRWQPAGCAAADPLDKGAAKILGAERLAEASDLAYDRVRRAVARPGECLAELVRCARNHGGRGGRVLAAAPAKKGRAQIVAVCPVGWSPFAQELKVRPDLPLRAVNVAERDVAEPRQARRK